MKLRSIKGQETDTHSYHIISIKCVPSRFGQEVNRLHKMTSLAQKCHFLIRSSAAVSPTLREVCRYIMPYHANYQVHTFKDKLDGMVSLIIRNAFKISYQVECTACN